MKTYPSKQLALAAALATVCAPTAFAQIFITEVAPWGSGNSSYTVDWFELTNTGASAVDITGWKIDDDSNAFGSAANLRNVTSIAPGQSVVFLDVAVANEAAKLAAFTSAWFGASAPSNFAFGYYNGAGGLGTGGDAINIFNSTGSPRLRLPSAPVMQSVRFKASTTPLGSTTRPSPCSVRPELTGPSRPSTTPRLVRPDLPPFRNPPNTPPPSAC